MIETSLKMFCYWSQLLPIFCTRAMMIETSVKFFSYRSQLLPVFCTRAMMIETSVLVTGLNYYPFSVPGQW